jgi:formate dehydrogenase subunit gamma
VWSGIALPVPLLISLAGPWGRQLRVDLRRCNLWSREEILWLRSLGRHRLRRADKFNPGQKLNVIFVGSAIVVMVGTGSIMYWLSYFPLEWRTGATFVHDVVAAAIVLVVIGHLVFVLTHVDALKAMFTGAISTAWAERHAPGWAAEFSANDQSSPSSPPSDLPSTPSSL